MYEALANLYCEPLYFEKAEELMLKAEFLYGEKNAILPEFYYTKFLFKKAAILKKSGFFNRSLELLRTLLGIVED